MWSLFKAAALCAIFCAVVATSVIAEGSSFPFIRVLHAEPLSEPKRLPDGNWALQIWRKTETNEAVCVIATVTDGASLNLIWRKDGAELLIWGNTLPGQLTSNSDDVAVKVSFDERVHLTFDTVSWEVDALSIDYSGELGVALMLARSLKLPIDGHPASLEFDLDGAYAAIMELTNCDFGGIETFSAQNPFNGGAGPVAWGSSSEAALRNSAAACSRRHETCASKGAWAIVGKERLFVTVCCVVDDVDRCIVTSTDGGGCWALRRLRQGSDSVF